MSNKPLAKVFHFDLYGKRETKYDFLNENSLKTVDWNALEPNSPNFFLVKKNFEQSGAYELGFKIDELFKINGMGITTGNDKELIDFESNKLKSRFINHNNLKKIYYRLFDVRYVNFDSKLVERAREKLMYNLLDKGNVGLVSLKGVRNGLLSKFGITKLIIDKSVISTLDNGYIFPLYLYPETTAQQSINPTAARTPNLNSEIVKQIAEKLGLTFVPEKENGSVCFANNNDELRDEFKQVFAPIDILDYIYAVLHSPTYREKYKEFLKIDFPRVPYPKASSPSDRAGGEVFWQLVKLGGEIRQIHLLESSIVEQYITQYPVDGNNVVSKPRFDSAQAEGFGRVYINDTQYFDNVPHLAWEFYIGGYQPAQKWLKDRKERVLEFDDILHYQKIIVALTETDRIMKEIDKTGIE